MTLILAIIPVLLLIILMAFFKMPGDKSSIISLVVTMLIALLGFTFSVDNLFYSFSIRSVKSCLPYFNHYTNGYFQLQRIAENRKNGDYKATVRFHFHR